MLAPSDTGALDFVELGFRQVQFSGLLPFSEIVFVHREAGVDDVLDNSWTICRRAQLDRSWSVLAERRGGLCFIHVSGGGTHIECAATTLSTAKSMASELTARLPPGVSGDEDDRVTEVRMWHRGRTGYLGPLRELNTTPWVEVRENYSADVAIGLDSVMAHLGDARRAGRLLLWSGPPGTGKTSAVRSLLHEWRSWCDGHIVIDPDYFFADPAYMSAVMTAGTPARWKLLIAEDCDDHLVPRPGRVRGPLSHLLNLTDGLFGQGSNTLVLITTNDPVDRIHPAMARPGRCMSRIDFTSLTAAEVARRTDHRMAVPMTLAELYAFRESGALPQQQQARAGYA